MGKKNKNNFSAQFDEPIPEKKKLQKPNKEEKTFEEEFFTPQERKKNKTKNRWEQKKAYKNKNRFDEWDEFN